MGFSEHFAAISSRRSSHSKALWALRVVILPTVFTALGVFTPELWKFSSLFTAGCWGILLAIYVAISWDAYPNEKDVTALLLENHQSENKLRETEARLKVLSSIVESLSFRSLYSISIRAMAAEYIKDIKKNGVKPERFSEMISEIMAPAYTQGDYLFGIHLSERWNFCLYLYDGSRQVLTPVWREKSSTHPSQGLGRLWAPGEGHVGKAFIDRKVIYTGNANSEAVAQLCSARASRLNTYDTSTYISFASIPLAISDEDDVDPLGVLVATSDIQDRFADPDSVETLIHFAGTIAAVLSASEADFACLFEAN